VVIRARWIDFESGAAIDGAAGTELVQQGTAWLTPHCVRAVLAYAKDLYLYGYLSETRALLGRYEDLLLQLEVSSDWLAMDESWQLELNQMRGEIEGLLHRLDSNLDFFGNPAGWVPNLSFEANLGLFRTEIDSAMRTLYLSYWLGNVASNLQQK